MVVLFGTAFLPLGSPASAGLFCFWRPVPSENSIRLANIVPGRLDPIVGRRPIIVAIPRRWPSLGSSERVHITLRRSRIQGDRGASAQRRRAQEGSATRPEAWERKPTAEAVLRRLRRRAPPALSRLRHITGVLLETALTDSGVEDARKRRRSACRSIWALWSRCRRLCNCLEPVRLERTLV